MILISIHLNNFLSHKDSKIYFEEGVTGILGETIKNEKSSNGTGKSSIFDAIRYVLYKYVRTSKEKDIVRDFAEDMFVELVLKDNEDEYIITRGRNKSNKTIFKFVKNGKNITPDRSDEFDQLILDIVKIPEVVFNTTILFSQKDNEWFVTVQSYKRLEFINKLINLDQFNDWIKQAKNKQTEYKLKKDSFDEKILNLDLKSIEEKINNIKFNIQDIMQNKIDVESSLEKAENEVVEIAKEGEKIKGVFEKNKSNLELIENNISNFRNSITKLNSKISGYKDLENQLNDSLKELEKNKFNLKSLELYQQYNKKEINQKLSEDNKKFGSLEYEIKSLKEQKKKLQDYKICPICKTDLDDEKISGIVDENKIRKLENDLLKLSEEITKNKSLLQKIEEAEEIKQIVESNELKITSLKKEILNIKSYEKEKKEKEIELENEVVKKQKLEKEIDNEKLQNDLNNTRKKYSECKDVITKLKFQIKDYDNSINELRDGIKQNQNLIKLHNEKLEEYEQYSKLFVVYKDAEEVFKQVKHKKLIEDIQYISELANETLDFFGAENEKIIFDLYKDEENSKRSLDIYLQINKEDKIIKRPLVSLSGGQLVKVNLAIRLGLALFVYENYNINLNFLCLDEVFAPLDENNRTLVMILLRKLLNYYKQVIVISHVSDIQDSLDEKIIVQMKDGISYVK